MKHIILFFYILSFATGFSSLGLILFVYNKTKNKALGHGILTFISFTMLLLAHSLRVYGSILNLKQSSVFQVIVDMFTLIGAGSMPFLAPILLHYIFNRNITLKIKAIFAELSVISVILFVVYRLFDGPYILLNINDLILLITITYCIFIAVTHRKDMNNPIILSIVKSYLTLGIAFLPLIVLDMFKARIPVIQSRFPYGLLSPSICYFASSILNIIFILKYDEPKQELSVPKLSDSFLELHAITAREKEIIELLMKGHTYNKIADELTISLTTVKKHVYNIYKKVGVKNKLELMDALLSESSHTKRVV
ncbi:MAG TPA: helix-turn-helix transcriptional regulator [Clostridia bacterium]